MSAVEAGSVARAGARFGPGVAARIGVGLATALVVLAAAVLPLLAAPLVHTMLDAAGSADLLGLPAVEAHRLSDRSVEELLLGPGTFDLVTADGQPFYDDAERRHLADARMLLMVLLASASVACLAIVVSFRVVGPRVMWAGVTAGGAAVVVGVVALALLMLVAFEPLFTLFHALFFPGGGWSFDGARQHLVQLYPTTFWQLAASCLALLAALMGSLTWWIGRARARAA